MRFINFNISISSIPLASFSITVNKELKPILKKNKKISGIKIKA